MDEENLKKKVDETWKEAAKKETPLTSDQNAALPPIDFLGFVSSLGLQAMIFLGEIPSPISNQKEESLPQAKFIIDTLLMLREKTVNNLSDEETKMLNDLIYALQVKFVEKQSHSKEPNAKL